MNAKLENLKDASHAVKKIQANISGLIQT